MNDDTTTVHHGLEGIVAASTTLSMVDGARGELLIAGYPVAGLALNATFEETVWLLWHGARPSATELRAFREDLAARRRLPPATLALLAAAADAEADGMDALRMAAGTLSMQSGTSDDD